MKFLMYGKQLFFLMMLFVSSIAFGMDLDEYKKENSSGLLQFFGDFDRYNGIPFENVMSTTSCDISNRHLWYCDQTLLYPSRKIIPKNPWEASYELPTYVLSVCFDNAQKQVVLAVEKEVHRYDMHLRKEIMPYLICDDKVHSVCCDGFGKLVIGSSDKCAYIFEGDKKINLKHQGCVTSVSTDRLGNYLATGSTDYQARIYDMQAQRWTSLFSYRCAVYAVSFNNSGTRLAVADGKDIHIVERDTEKTLAKFTTLDNESVYSLCLTPCGDYVAVGTRRGMVYVFDVEIPNQCTSFDLKGYGGINSVCFDNFGNYLAIGTNSKMCIIDMNTKQEIASFGHKGNIWSVCFDSSSTHLATGEENQARIFALCNTCTLQQLMVLKMINLCLRVQKPSKKITAIGDFFTSIILLCTSRGVLFDDELIRAWYTFRQGLRDVMWNAIQKTITLHGKD